MKIINIKKEKNNLTKNKKKQKNEIFFIMISNTRNHLFSFQGNVKWQKYYDAENLSIKSPFKWDRRWSRISYMLIQKLSNKSFCSYIISKTGE